MSTVQKHRQAVVTPAQVHGNNRYGESIVIGAA